MTPAHSISSPCSGSSPPTPLPETRTSPAPCGACFLAWFPPYPWHVSSIPLLFHHRRKGTPMSTRVLLIEDDGAALHHMNLALIKAGYQVETARNLPEAYDKLSQQTLTYAAILTDYNLGRRNQTGLEVWQFARASRFSGIFIGSSAEMENWQRVVDHGDDPNFHAVPKKDFHWDDTAVITKLQQLGITP
ncbi:MAG: response regulator [Alphaproteobacteria bacterium]|nr:MAG: response regulator [Alphaproteobacteria bacterium]